MIDLFIKIRNNNLFEAFVVLVILVSAVSIGFRSFDVEMQVYLVYLNYLDYFITLFFLVEILIRIIAETVIIAESLLLNLFESL